MVGVNVPALVTVPLMSPLALLMDNPLGKLVAVKVYGDVPPLAVTYSLYGLPMVGAVKAEVLMDIPFRVYPFQDFDRPTQCLPLSWHTAFHRFGVSSRFFVICA
jgi:hypothetical protein